MEKSKKNLLWIIVGVACIIFAIVCLTINPDLSHGTNPSYAYYGGDAYTGIQHAAVDTARNIQTLSYNLEDLIQIIMRGFGFAFIISGLAFIIKAVINYNSTKAPKEIDAVVETK